MGLAYMLWGETVRVDGERSIREGFSRRKTVMMVHPLSTTKGDATFPEHRFLNHSPYLSKGGRGRKS